MGSVALVCAPLSDLIDCTHQAPLFMELPRQVCWSGLPFASLGDILYTGIKSKSLMSPAFEGGFFITSSTWETPCWGIKETERLPSVLGLTDWSRSRRVHNCSSEVMAVGQQ